MALESFSLDGKAAIVTGGSRGLGLGIAHELRAAGASYCRQARRPGHLAPAPRLLYPTGMRPD